MPRHATATAKWAMAATTRSGRPSAGVRRTRCRRWASSSSSVATTLPKTIARYDLLDRGPLDYSQTWGLQQALLHRRLQPPRRGQQQQPSEDGMLLVELAPVYTLGRGAREEHLAFCHKLAIVERLSRTVRGPGTARLSLDAGQEAWLKWRAAAMGTTLDEWDPWLALGTELTESVRPVLAPNGIPCYRVDRGGEVTHHGPSQLVVYPMLDLSQDPYRKDLHWYVRRLERAVIRALDTYGIQAGTDPDHTGVWVGDAKIAAIGVSASRWITTHGLALNVAPDLTPFDTSLILPCGIEGRGVTSLEEELLRHQHPSTARVPTLAEVAEVLLESLEEVFGVSVVDHHHHRLGNGKDPMLGEPP